MQTPYGILFRMTPPFVVSTEIILFRKSPGTPGKPDHPDPVFLLFFRKFRTIVYYYLPTDNVYRTSLRSDGVHKKIARNSTGFQGDTKNEISTNISMKTNKKIQ